MSSTERNVPTSSTLHPWLGVSQNTGTGSLIQEESATLAAQR